MGEGEKSVVAEEANLGLDVREKVYTTHNDRPSALFESSWVVQLGVAPSGLRELTPTVCLIVIMPRN